MAQSHETYKKRMEYLVYGYNREIETEFTSLKIPKEIKQICIQFYNVSDYFTNYGDNILVNEAGNIAMGTTTKDVPNTVYGDQIIDLEDDTISKYRWEFKIFHLDRSKPYYIGISTIDEIKPNRGRLVYSFSDLECHTIDWFGNVRGLRIGILIKVERIWRWNDETQTKELDHIHTICVLQQGHVMKKYQMTREYGTKYRVGIILSHITQRAQILMFKITNFPLIDESNDESNEENMLRKYVNESIGIFKNIANIF